MSAVAEDRKNPAAKFGSQVDEQIAQATSRIRTHDITLGGLTLAAMVAVYATTMILLDKSLNLAEWVRQLSLLGFLAAFSAVGYFLIVRPLSKRINPLYAAARVEDTIDDPKNSVTGYVEAQENGGVHAAVKAAMSAKAAKAAAEADVNRAVDHRSLLIAGGVLVVFLIALAVLFFVFRPTQFTSLMGRTFMPVSSDPIATQTQITLLKPEPAEPTITTGQTVTVAVHLGGRIPPKDGTQRARVLLRHNPTDPSYDELAMQEGETSREWQIKVPEYLVQNGFWYKVAAGDAVTPEYKVTVRSLPLFTDFEVSNEFPKYTRKPPEKHTDPNVRVYRGTKVTLLARTNREVRDGQLKFEAAGLAPIAGKPAPGRPDTLQFTFTATEATRYKLHFTSTTGERNTDPAWFQIALDSDAAPRVEIVKPTEPETTAPANGQLKVDATVGDDFGIDKVRLRLRVAGRDLTPVPYEGGKSFRRDTDNTWPTDLAYKGSADLTKLGYADGGKFEPTADMVIEYWVEAIDNCTETKPVDGWGEKPQPGNVGRSDVRKLRLTPPQTEDEAKKDAEQQKEQRKNEEKQHNDQQNKKFADEKRDPPKPQADQPQPKEADNPEHKEGDPKPKDGDKKGETGGAAPKPGEPKKEESKQDPKPGDKKDGMGGMTDPSPKKEDAVPPKTDGKKDPNEKATGGGTDMKTDPMPKTSPENKGGQPDPKTDPKTDPSGMGGMGGTNNKTDTAPMPKTPEEKRAEQDAKQVENELNKNKGPAGDAKPNPTTKPDDRTEPAQGKPQPKEGPPPDSKTKEPPKPGEPMANPMGGDKDSAAQSKPEGALEKPTDPSQPKPDPKQPDAAKPDPKSAPPAERREEPLGGNPGQEKPEPKKDDAKGGTPPPKKDPNTDPNSGSSAKPCPNPTADPSGNPGMGDAANKPEDMAGRAKPNPDPTRGGDKNPQPKGAPPADEKPKGDPNAGGAKPDKAPDAGGKKPAPSDPGMKEPDASTPKPEPKGTPDNAAETRPDQKADPMGGTGGTGAKGGKKEEKGEKDIDRGTDKPEAGTEKAPMPNEAGEPKDKTSGDGKKLDDKQLKELKDAAKDLQSDDKEKQKAAREKLDKAIGEQNRKAIEDMQKRDKEELEQLQKDLDSDDPKTRDAARQKLQEKLDKLNEQTGKNGKQGEGKKLSEQEVEDLAQKARDLNSPDPEKRKEAEKALDDKIGKEARERIQKEMEKREKELGKEPDKKNLDDLKKDIQNQGGKFDKDWKPGGGPDSSPTPKAEEADPRNKAKTAQLQLEEFEKHRFDKDLHDKLGWTQKQYEEFLEAQRKRSEQLQKEAKDFEQELAKPKDVLGDPTIDLGKSSGKVDGRPTKVGEGATGGGAVFAPPGFEDPKKKFQDAIRKAEPKK